MKWEILVIDDDSSMLELAQFHLTSEGNSVSVASLGEEGIALASERRFDVVLTDLNLPDLDGLDLVKRIKEASPDTEIVVLTMQNEPVFARRALQAGVRGYVLKEAADTELVQAVRSAAAGDTYLQPALGARLAAGSGGHNGDELSERERDVLRLIALGHTNAEVAEQLYISIRTVESHRAHIQQKLRLSSRAELVRYALEHGLVET